MGENIATPTLPIGQTEYRIGYWYQPTYIIEYNNRATIVSVIGISVKLDLMHILWPFILSNGIMVTVHTHEIYTCRMLQLQMISWR